jgi:hypothetical protein
MKKQTKHGSKKGLVGKWFHSFETIEERDQYKPHWQGQVLSKHPNNMYLVQSYEWLMGEPLNQLLVEFKDMKFWIFYEDNETMKFQHNNRK